MSGKTIAKKGDIVTFVSDHDNVLIVELNGNRFAVNTKKLVLCQP